MDGLQEENDEGDEAASKLTLDVCLENWDSPSVFFASQVGVQVLLHIEQWSFLLLLVQKCHLSHPVQGDFTYNYINVGTEVSCWSDVILVYLLY